MRPSPRDRILLLLKTDGPRTASALGEALGLTGEAARQQLTRLAAEGLVEAGNETVAGRGRPRQAWRLTGAGHRTFPDGHADMTVALIDAIGAELGPQALETVIAARERKTQAAYHAVLGTKETLEERIDALAALRSAEGYMADWWRQPDGSFVLVENHCPICAAASLCRNFCRSELEIFRAVLDAPVERFEHVLSGSRRCAYRIGA